MCSTRNAIRVLLIVVGRSLLGAPGLPAQTPPPKATSPGGSIAGVVFDSLVTRAPLAGAEVFIAGYERTVRADARGRFRVDALAPGAHDVTFSSPTLDSLGLGVPVWSVVVVDGRATTATFATPSPRTVHERLCSTSDASTGVLMGRVRDAATGAPVADARVTATWSDWTLRDGAMRRRDRIAAAETDPGGAYRLCAVPNDIPVALQARNGVTATGVVAAVLGGVRAGFRSLAISSIDTLPETAPGDSVPLGRVTGSARLAGKVTIKGGRPVADARVRILGLPGSTRTDTSGRFLLTNVPGGTQTIQVIALGAAPAQVAIDVIPGAVARADVAMDRTGVTLETVAVVGRPVGRPTIAAGFAFRSQAGFGHFVNREDIERRRPFNLTDMFRAMPGVALVYSETGLTTHVRMTRSAGFGKNAGGCAPVVLVDYVKISLDGSMSIDDFVRPSDVLAVEVYPGIAGMPPFALGEGSVCGAVIIWTRLGA